MTKVWGTVLTPHKPPLLPSTLSMVPGLSHTRDVCSQEVRLRQCGDKVKVQRVKNPHSAVSAATEDVVMIHRDAVCHSGLRRTQHTRRWISMGSHFKGHPTHDRENSKLTDKGVMVGRAEVKSSPGSKEKPKNPFFLSEEFPGQGPLQIPSG